MTIARLTFLTTFLLLISRSQGAGCHSDLDCENDGICDDLGLHTIDHTEVFSRCVCMTGFTGTFCEDPCPIKCRNGGQCQLHSDDHGGLLQASDYICECPAAFEGPLCADRVAQNNNDSSDDGDDGESSSSFMQDTGVWIAGGLVGCALVVLLAIVVQRRGMTSTATKSTADGTTKDDGVTVVEEPTVPNAVIT